MLCVEQYHIQKSILYRTVLCIELYHIWNSIMYRTVSHVEQYYVSNSITYGTVLCIGQYDEYSTHINSYQCSCWNLTVLLMYFQASVSVPEEKRQSACCWFGWRCEYQNPATTYLELFFMMLSHLILYHLTKRSIIVYGDIRGMSAGRTSDPAPGAWFIPKFIPLTQCVPGPV